VVLDGRALRGHRRAPDVRDYLDGMRVAHREDAHLDVRAGHVERVGRALLRGRERHLARIESRRAHVHGDLPGVLHARHDHAARGLDADLALRGEALVEHEAREAARAVAALLHLAAVRVVDTVAEIVRGIGGLLDHEQLVAADAEMAIGDCPHELGRERHRLAHAVQHDEVVSLALHLGECELHVRL
jgi:hypothetical protein